MVILGCFVACTRRVCWIPIVCLHATPDMNRETSTSVYNCDLYRKKSRPAQLSSAHQPEGVSSNKTRRREQRLQYIFTKSSKKKSKKCGWSAKLAIAFKQKIVAAAPHSINSSNNKIAFMNHFFHAVHRQHVNGAYNGPILRTFSKIAGAQRMKEAQWQKLQYTVSSWI